MELLSGGGRAAALWVGLHLLLLLVLSLLVTRQRRKHTVVIGDGGVAELALAQRAFGNATEYVPPALAGLAVMALVAIPPLAIHIAGFLMFVSRVAHAIGISRSEALTFGRGAGMLGTWVAYIFMAVTLLFYAIF
ncbi:MAG: MAPEG family protein [Caulobacteraceae bacterium]|nr:MAPEG family protein [Caulobacteraceae bacterium]